MRRRLLGAALLALSLAACATTPTQRTMPLAALPGWSGEDYAAALSAFRDTCGVSRQPATARACREARAAGPLDASRSRAFLETRFVAEAEPESGVLTAYFTPVYPARRTADPEFRAPVRPKPDDLKLVDAGVFDPAQAGHPATVLDAGDGRLLPYPDRAAIEARPARRPLAWMRPEDLFFLQVQGSGVLVFPDGARIKALYAASNGQPFVAIAGPMRAQGLLAAGETSASAIHAWLAANRGPRADAVMRLDPRYAFFSLAPDDGGPPAGAAGVALPAHRALAVDPAYHALGEVLWIDADQPALGGAVPRYQGLATALDVGGGIKGPGRADLYLGEGDAAGAEAGRVRHALRLYRLVPKEPAA